MRSEYAGYGSDVIMDKVGELPALEQQLALIKDVLRDQHLTKKLAGNPRFAAWLVDNKEYIIAIYQTE